MAWCAYYACQMTSVEGVDGVSNTVTSLYFKMSVASDIYVCRVHRNTCGAAHRDEVMSTLAGMSVATSACPFLVVKPF